MPTIKQALADVIPEYRERVAGLVNEYGEKVVSEITLRQAFEGLRGVRAVVCDTSCVHPEKGLSIRGMPVSELADRHPEEIFYLLLTSRLPTGKELAALRSDLAGRVEVPAYVWDILRAMPKDAHPMDMLITAIAAMENGSVFRRRYEEGMAREDQWEAALEDSLTLLARLPALASGVHRIRYEKGDPIPPDPSLPWATDFARMMDIEDEDFAEVLRIYLVLHCDHEGGDLSAFTSRAVGSGLADVYYAVTAGLCGLAGPLHGLANQEALRFHLEAIERFGAPPRAEDIEALAWERLNAGRVIPGYGHPVLKVTDPRFKVFHAFGTDHMADDPVFQTVDIGARVIPGVLKEHGKARNKYPNVDAISGCMLYHYGITGMECHTVLFSVSRAMGMLAQLVLCRAMLEPLTTPKSVTLEWMTHCMEATEVAMTPGD